MAQLTNSERTAWTNAYTAARAERQHQCTQPRSDANPIQPRTPGQRIGSLSVARNTGRRI